MNQILNKSKELSEYIQSKFLFSCNGSNTFDPNYLHFTQLSATKTQVAKIGHPLFNKKKKKQWQMHKQVSGLGVEYWVKYHSDSCKHSLILT